ncbi:MAG: hypothetical protein K2M79_00545 [Muribaculaceae bacterium]|nr:hypothetical protein [Muribaculaceae bacterium]
MKKFILTLFGALMCASAATAQIEITKVDAFNGSEAAFMDMAVTAAESSVVDGGVADGAVIILNGAWHATGKPANGKSSIEVALSKARKKNLKEAVIYSVAQPTTAAGKALAEAAVKEVVFLIPAERVVANGIYKQEDYTHAETDSEETSAVPARNVADPSLIKALNLK